jgi:hypothetical protein
MRAYSGFLHKYFNWLDHLVERSAYTAVTSISGHNCQVVHMSKSVCKIMPLLLPQHSRWYQWIYDALTHSTLVLYQCLLCYCFYTSVSYLLAISWLFENLNFECWNLIDMLIVTPSPYCIVCLWHVQKSMLIMLFLSQLNGGNCEQAMIVFIQVFLVGKLQLK